jgi:transposase-like protein
LLPISDGAPGLTGAFDRAFPTSLRQRCLVHRARKESTCRRAGVRRGGAHTTPASPQDGKRHIVSFRLHFLRNVLAQVPKGSAEMVAAAIRTIFAQPDAAHVHQ